MSRISAREAVVASSAVSAIVSLCVLASLPGSSTLQATAQDTGASSYSSDEPLSMETVADRAAMSGSHQGVWFRISDNSARSTSSTPDLFADVLAAGTPTAPPAAAAPSKPAEPGPAAQKPAVLQEKTRSSVLAAVSNDPRDIAQALASTRGWTGSQWVCLDKLWLHESKFQTTVRNSSSGAYGIPQALPASKMATAGSDWRTNPVTQIEWGLGYIEARYGSPCGAWSYWTRHYSY